MKLTIITISAIIGLCIGFLLGMGYSLNRNMKTMQIGDLPLSSGQTLPFLTEEDLQKELTDFANNRREFYKKTHNGGVK